jgi:hypothetical protein
MQTVRGNAFGLPSNTKKKQQSKSEKTSNGKNFVNLGSFQTKKRRMKFVDIKDADRHTWKKEELIAYDNASIAEQDVRGKMKFVVDKRNKEIVIKCYKKEMSTEDIHDITDLPIENIKTIIEEYEKRKEG